MPQLSFNDQKQQTPLMRQYCEIKKQCPDAILFFRLGDFYEMFFDDAVTAAPVLDIALTSRDKNAQNPIPLCGVPFHSAQSYIIKLLDAGHKVAICEQVEAPTAGKKIVKREIVRLITPGTRTDQEGLPSDQANYMASVLRSPRGITLVWLDIHEGKIEYAHHLDINDAQALLQTIKPSELVCFDSSVVKQLSMQAETIDSVPMQDMKAAVLTRFSASHQSVLGLESHEDVMAGLYALIHYVEEINLTQIGQLEHPAHFEKNDYVTLDQVTQKNLELFTADKPSLLKVLNYTKTSGGARCLQQWMARPLRDQNKINARLNTVAYLLANTTTCTSLQTALREVGDMQRLMGRLVTGKALVRDLLAVRTTLVALVQIKALLQNSQSPQLQNIANGLVDMDELRALLQNALAEAPSLNLADGHVIADGYDQDLDHYRQLARDNKSWIASLQEQERQATGISSLKIGYNKVFGYYLEVTKAHSSKVPQGYIRKQTLTNAERFITQALKDKEEEILSAKQNMLDLESRLFADLSESCQKQRDGLLRNHQLLSTLDVLASFATAAQQHQLRKPVVDNEHRIDIKQGRHPIVEASLTETPFVPNDVLLDANSQRFILLTGPNMAGKSTVMRQVALIVLMAQMGCFVPAASAEIGMIDQIFTRIGAQDDVTQGRSTFMVEMNETAHILQSATDRSLVLLDEIGRGTSTYDGVSIAWAVSSYLHDRIKAKTIFATHYHELVEMAQTHASLACYKMQVRTWKDEIIFLRKMEKGSVERSYGIEVAQLAGVPMPVIEEAKTVLTKLESPQNKQNHKTKAKPSPQDAASELENKLSKTLANLHPDELTPKQALDFLYQLKNQHNT